MIMIQKKEKGYHHWQPFPTFTLNYRFSKSESECFTSSIVSEKSLLSLSLSRTSEPIRRALASSGKDLSVSMAEAVIGNG